MIYKGQTFGDWRVFEYELDTDTYLTQHTSGRVARVSKEFVADQIEKEKHLNSYTGRFVNPDNTSFGYGFGQAQRQVNYNTLAEKAEAQRTETLKQFQYQFSKIMTRLTQYNDWTILIEDNKLIAVNSSNNTVRAKGSLLSAGGRAWMYTHGQLWSGELERHETEKEARDNVKHLALEKIREKHNKKIALAEKKLDDLNAAKSQALRNL